MFAIKGRSPVFFLAMTFHSSHTSIGMLEHKRATVRFLYALRRQNVVNFEEKNKLFTPLHIITMRERRRTRQRERERTLGRESLRDIRRLRVSILAGTRNKIVFQRGEEGEMEESAFAVGWLCSASMRRADCVQRIRDDR